MGLFDEYLKDYKPEEVKDGGFTPFKGEYDCVVTSCKVEDYKGDKMDELGSQVLKYELTVGEGQENAGRKLWKSFYFLNPKEDKKGKTAAKKMADTFFTLGLEFKDEASFEDAIDAFSNLTIRVKAYYTPNLKDQEGNPRQLHTVKGVADKDGVVNKSDVPF